MLFEIILEEFSNIRHIKDIWMGEDPLEFINRME